MLLSRMCLSFSLGFQAFEANITFSNNILLADFSRGVTKSALHSLAVMLQ